MRWSTPHDGKSVAIGLDDFQANIRCVRLRGQVSRCVVVHFEVGVSIGRSGWRWKKVDAKTWPKAEKQAPEAVAALLVEIAEELCTESERLKEHAERLKVRAVCVVAGSKLP